MAEEDYGPADPRPSKPSGHKTLGAQDLREHQSVQASDFRLPGCAPRLSVPVEDRDLRVQRVLSEALGEQGGAGLPIRPPEGGEMGESAEELPGGLRHQVPLMGRGSGHQ